MPLQSVREVLLKAGTDASFRKSLVGDPGKALRGYDLTDEERQCLSNLSEEQFASSFQKQRFVSANDIRF